MVEDKLFNKEEKYIIPNLDKEWYNIILSCNELDYSHAGALLTELYEAIPLLFGFPKRIFNKDLNEFVLNPDWLKAKDWIDYHSGWSYRRINGEIRLVKHPLKELLKRFSLNGDLFK